MIPHLLILLADVAASATPPARADSDTLREILPWVTTFVVAVLSVVLGKKMGKAEAQGMRLEEPVPTVPVVKIQGPVSWFQHEGLERRVGVLEQEFKTMEERQASQFLSLLNAGHEREVAIKDKIDGVAREWHARLDDQFGPRPKKPGGAR